MTEPLSPRAIKALSTPELSVTAKIMQARADQLQRDAAEMQRSAVWARRELGKRRRVPA